MLSECCCSLSGWLMGNNNVQEKCKLLGEIEGGAIEFNLNIIIIHSIRWKIVLRGGQREIRDNHMHGMIRFIKFDGFQRYSEDLYFNVILNNKELT